MERKKNTRIEVSDIDKEALARAKKEEALQLAKGGLTKIKIPNGAILTRRPNDYKHLKTRE